MRISDWGSDVCSSDLWAVIIAVRFKLRHAPFPIGLAEIERTRSIRTFVPGGLVLESACQFFGAACLDRVRLRFGQRAAETRCTCRDLRTRTRACLAQKAFARARPVPGIRKLLTIPSNPVAILRRDTDVDRKSTRLN